MTSKCYGLNGSEWVSWVSDLPVVNSGRFCWMLVSSEIDVCVCVWCSILLLIYLYHTSGWLESISWLGHLYFPSNRTCVSAWYHRVTAPARESASGCSRYQRSAKGIGCQRNQLVTCVNHCNQVSRGWLSGNLILSQDNFVYHGLPDGTCICIISHSFDVPCCRAAKDSWYDCATAFAQGDTQSDRSRQAAGSFRQGIWWDSRDYQWHCPWMAVAATVAHLDQKREGQTSQLAVSSMSSEDPRNREPRVFESHFGFFSVHISDLTLLRHGPLLPSCFLYMISFAV